MKQSVRPVLAGAVAFALLGLAPLAVLPAHATVQEIILNSSTVQIVHNPSPETDVLNLSLDVTNDGDAGSCDGGLDDLLESGVRIGVAEPSCASQSSSILFLFSYVEHDIGSSSYGTFFESLGPSFTAASKIVPLATPAGACGRWKINFQATGLDLSGFTSAPIALLVGDGENDAGSNIFQTACFNVNANIGNGITKPHQGAHRARH
jgi:hypothetical protein